MYSRLILEYGTEEKRIEILELFYSYCLRDGVTLLHEWDTTPEEFYHSMKTELREG